MLRMLMLDGDENENEEGKAHPYIPETGQAGLEDGVGGIEKRVNERIEE